VVRLTKNGFALPTVMITSVVMLTVLLTGLVTVSTTSTSIRNQYYDQLVREAAESGVNYITGCVRSGATPSSASVYTPQSTSCSNNAVDTSKSKYILDTSSSGGIIIKTRFDVNGPAASSSGYYEVSSTGYAELYRTSNTTAPWQTLRKTIKLRLQFRQLLASAVASGSYMACGVLSGQSYCWGWNTDGRLGNGTRDAGGQTYEADGPDLTPSSTGNALGLQQPGNPPVRTKVVRPGDTIPPDYTIGAPNNASSKLSHHEIAISIGQGFACAITTTAADALNVNLVHADRKVVCWGDQTDGALGNGASATLIIPFPIYTTANWALASPAQYPVQIVTGKNHSCVMTEKQASDTSGNVWCWGKNDQGQLGTDSTSPAVYNTPQKTVSALGVTSGVLVSDLATSFEANHTCGIRTGDVVCWGDNSHGQIGNGASGTNRVRPTTVDLSSSANPLLAKDISVSGEVDATAGNQSTSCAVGKAGTGMVDGALYCWGSNKYGQIGGGSTGAQATAVTKATQIPSIRDVAGTLSTAYTATRVVSGSRGSCAVLSSVTISSVTKTNQVACWGNNEFGALGTGETMSLSKNDNRPTLVAGLSNQIVTDIAGGGHRFCAVITQNVYCWGRNDKGQIGDGTTTNRNVPTRSTFYDPISVGITY